MKEKEIYGVPYQTCEYTVMKLWVLSLVWHGKLHSFLVCLEDFDLQNKRQIIGFPIEYIKKQVIV